MDIHQKSLNLITEFLVEWIPIVEYSIKYRLSLSTIRRRIKAQLVEYRMEAGRYLIRDSEGTPVGKLNNAPINDSAQMLLQEIKKAYGSILSEKEEMIVQLRNEIEDLRKLNLLLEREIERMTVSSLHRPPELYTPGP